MYEIIHPKTCKFFLWTLLHEWINTMDMLQRRLPTWNIKTSCCILCKAAEKDRNHLFSFVPSHQSFGKKLKLSWTDPYSHQILLICAKKSTRQRVKQKNKLSNSTWWLPPFGIYGTKETKGFSRGKKN